MNSRKRKIVSLTFSAVVFAVFALLTGVETTVTLIRQAVPMLYVGAAVVMIVSYWMRAYIWHRLFEQLSLGSSLWQSSKLYFGAFGLKLVLPMGHMTLQPVIAYTIANKNDFETKEAFAAISVGDTFNFIPFYTIGLVGFFVLLFRQASTESIELYLVSLVLSLVLIIGVVWAFFQRTELLHTGLQYSVAPIRFLGEAVDSKRIRTVVSYKRIERQFWDFHEQVIGLLQQRTETIIQVIIAHIGVGLFIWSFTLVSQSVQFEIGFFVAAVIIAFSRVGSVVPTPGGVGGIESVMIAVGIAITPYSISEVTAVVILFRLISYWGVMGLGLLFVDELGAEWE